MIMAAVLSPVAGVKPQSLSVPPWANRVASAMFESNWEIAAGPLKDQKRTFFRRVILI